MSVEQLANKQLRLRQSKISRPMDDTSLEPLYVWLLIARLMPLGGSRAQYHSLKGARVGVSGWPRPQAEG